MLRVLIVDDYKDSAKSMTMLLGLSGYETEAAESGESALLAVGRNWPNAVLLDIGMPGMDGFEVARRIKEMAVGRAMPAFIAISGYHESALSERFRDEGFCRCLLKPADRSELVQILEGLPA
jgi:CheY-like chemotaxis protein